MIANTGQSSQLKYLQKVEIELVFKVDFTTRWLCYHRNRFSPLEGYKQKMGRKCKETLVIKIDPALRHVQQLPAPTSLSEVSLGPWA